MRMEADMKEYRKIPSKNYRDVLLRVVPGHFVTPNTHVNYYMDMSGILHRQSEAKAAAEALAGYFSADKVIDTIICLDGTEIVAAYLANELTRAGVLSKNAHKTMYILTPEYDLSGQMIFRRNLEPWVSGKNVLLLLATTTTGETIAKAGQSINYYGGIVVGIGAIFSAVNAVDGHPVHALFRASDLPDYRSYRVGDCPMCRAKQRVDAICNGFGYSPL